MRVGDDVAVLRQDDAGADGRAARQLGHHRDGGGIDPPVDLLNGQRVAVTVRVDKAYAVVRRYDRQLRLGALVKLAIVIIVVGIVIVVAVIAAVEAVRQQAEPPGGVQPAGENEDRGQTDKENFQPTVSLAARFGGRLLRGGFRLSAGQRAVLHIVSNVGLRLGDVLERDLIGARAAE